VYHGKNRMYTSVLEIKHLKVFIIISNELESESREMELSCSFVTACIYAFRLTINGAL